MRLDASRAIGGYAAATTLALGWLVLGGAAPGPARFGTIEAERINIREPDGTLRLAIASHARMPGLVVDGREYPHPNRPEAGLIFYNDEGTENGGLVFDGRMRDGQPSNGGSLTFDRWHQDQTVQVVSSEEGRTREAALIVNDRPDQPIDFGETSRITAMSKGPARDAAVVAAHLAPTQRAYLGRAKDGTATLVLRDAGGRPRLTLAVASDGAPAITFLDEQGRVARAIR